MKINCMMSRLKLYTHHLAVRFNEDFSIPLTCKNLLQMCCRLCNMLQLWGRGGMVDTLVLGTSLVRGGSSSLLDPTKSEKKHLSIITKLFISDLGIWLGLMWTKPLGSNRYTFLQGI